MSPSMRSATEQLGLHHDNAVVDNHKVEVWVCDVKGTKHSVKMPVSSRLVDVMQKVGEQHGRMGRFQGIVVGFKGGRKVGGWNERTIVSQTLPIERPSDFNEEQYLRDNPIRLKFKVRRVKPPAALKRVL